MKPTVQTEHSRPMFNYGAYLHSLLVGVKESIIYRFEFFNSVTVSLLVPVMIQLALWQSIFSDPQTTTIAGQTHPQFLQYTLVSVLFFQIRGGDHDFYLAELIRTGGLSQYLLRPIGFLRYFYCQAIGSKLIVLAVSLICALVASSFAEAFQSTSLVSILLGFTLALLGNLIHYLLSCLLTVAAFYWEEATSLLMAKNLVTSVLCGELIPLTLFPKQTLSLLEYLPFHLYVYTPTQIANQTISHNQILQMFGLAVVWIAVLSALLNLAFNTGLKHYQSLGN